MVTKVIRDVDIDTEYLAVRNDKLSVKYRPASSSIVSVSGCVGSEMSNAKFSHSANVRYIEYRNANTNAVVGVELYIFAKMNHKTWRKETNGVLQTPIHINLKSIATILADAGVVFTPTKLRGLIHEYSPTYSDLTAVEGAVLMGTRVNFNADTLVLSVVDQHAQLLGGTVETPTENQFSCRLQLLV